MMPDSSSFKAALSIEKQRLLEKIFLIEIILSILMLSGFVSLIFRKRRSGFNWLAQVHRTTRFQPFRKLVEPFIKREITIAHKPLHITQVKRMDSELGKRIMVLKRPGPKSERGVIYLMFNEVIGKFPAVVNMEKLLSQYYLVLEPSWAGYCSDIILQYTQYKEAIFVTCPEDEDFNFLARLATNLKPLPFGARDWVDPRLYEQCSDQSGTKKFDIVMNAHWGRGKRHYILFERLKMLPSLKVALIGVPWDGGTLEDIKALARYYDIENQLTFFERIPYNDVMKVTAQSKIGLLLSLKEGGNRAIPECLFCDVPAIVLTQNVGGVKNIINSQTGLHVTEDKLVWAIRFMLDNLGSYSPRKWALDNISCLLTTSRLNSCLRAYAFSRGEPWTRDIVPRTNAPESKYYNPEDEEEYRLDNLNLKEVFSNLKQ